MVPYRRRSSLAPMDVFKEFFGRDVLDDFFSSNRLSAEMVGGFCADIKEVENGYLVEAELPGYKKENIEIDLVDDRLTITAKKEDELSEDKDNYIRRERRFGQVSRSYLVSGIDNEGVSADYVDGILTVNLPKLEEVKPKNTRIDIN